MPDDLPAEDLLNDVLTFLCCLHANDIAPRGKRFLAPSALVWINKHFVVRDQLENIPDSAQEGKRVARELDTARIRFIHFLCEAAGLIAHTGRFLKPTPRATLFLNASDHEHAARLFKAAFPIDSDRSHDDLWCAYRLPGWRLASLAHSLSSLFEVLRQAPHGERIRLTTLLKLVPLAALDDESHPDAQPENILRGVLTYLAWFDAVEWHSSAALHLTDWGAALLGRADSPLPRAGEGQGGRAAVLTGADFEIEISGDWPTLYELSDYSELSAVQPRRAYHLDRARIHRAFERGTSLASILDFLESASGKALPATLVRQIQLWAVEHNRITVRRVVLLEVRDPRLLAELTRAHRIRNSIRRTVSPRAVILREDRLPSLIRNLQRRGLTPRLALPHPRTSVPRYPTRQPANQLPDHKTARLFDHPTLAHLYLTARLCHQLSDLIPARYRIPYSILLDLERQLTISDRDLAAQLAEEAAEHVAATIDRRQHTAERAGTEEDPWLPAAASRLSPIVIIERAVQSAQPLDITYTDARRVTTSRIIEPHRIEQWGQTKYLIAYCRLDQDERTFRIDRIREIRNAE